MRVKSILLVTAVLLVSSSVANASTTSGPITNAETWSGTVLLTGDVTVRTNGSLTILPGSRIESTPRADDQVGGLHTSRIELIVDRGTFNAVGTEAAPIVFTTALLGTNPPAKGDWYGLRINSANATMGYCRVEYGTDGLRIEGGTPSVEHCSFNTNAGNGVWFGVSATLSACSAKGNATGIDAESNARATLLNCVLSSNTGPGPWTGWGAYAGGYDGSTILLRDCIVDNNGGGVGCFGPGSGVDYFTLVNTTVSNSKGYGIYTMSYGGATLTNCTVVGNQASGIQLWYLRVYNSTVSFNSGDGICGGAGLAVYDSTITGNKNNGVASGFSWVVEIRGNLVYGNGIGVSISGGGTGDVFTNIIGNDLFGNSDYEIKNQGPAAIIADSSFWGEPTTTELSNHVANLTKIYDSRDNASVGQVVIRTWSRSPLHEAAPWIIVQPLSQLVVPGANVQFSVVALGTYPLSYQWQKDSTLIAWATNATLLLTNVQAGDVGSYMVTVTNSLGSTNSAAATLTVDLSALAPVLSLNMYAGLTFSGVVGKTYSVQYLNDFTQTNNWFDWLTLTNFTLPSSPYRFIDWGSPGCSSRFYRAVQTP